MSLHMKAREAAKEAHTSIGQKRQFGEKGDYHLHVWAVADLVATVTDDEEVLAAACLHDVLEDVTPKNAAYGPEWIVREFGERVFQLVVELTDQFTKEAFPELNRKARKALEHKRLSEISEDAKLIKRADLHDNGRTIPETERFYKLWLEEKAELDALLGTWEDVVTT